MRCEPYWIAGVRKKYYAYIHIEVKYEASRLKETSVVSTLATSGIHTNK